MGIKKFNSSFIKNYYKKIRINLIRVYAVLYDNQMLFLAVDRINNKKEVMQNKKPIEVISYQEGLINKIIWFLEERLNNITLFILFFVNYKYLLFLIIFYSILYDLSF